MNTLFDLDGTIGNTLPLCIEAFRKAIEPLQNKRITDSEIIAQFGPSEEGTIKALIPENYDEGMEKYIEWYKLLHHKWAEPFEGIVDILSALKAKETYVGLVTGKGPVSTEITLEAYGLTDFFDGIKTGSIRGPVKKERMEEVLQETHYSPSDFIYIGDAPSDIIAARACGIKVVAAAWAPTSNCAELESMNPDYLFRSIQDFRTFIDQHILG
ncbi:MAG: HAD-IA family hydrolase [Pontiella sp.]